jgi:hypothetical protein
MKKAITIIMVGFFLLAFALAASAQIAKEGTIAGTMTYAGTYRTFPLDKDRIILVYENTGVRLEDSGQGPFHGCSTHNVGVQYFEKGIGRLKGYVTTMDKDGDKVLFEITEDASQPFLKETNGTGKIIGGTGKFTGIQGNMEYTRHGFRPVSEGTTQAISKYRGSWKIVEPK